jgi:hypothetical protein
MVSLWRKPGNCIFRGIPRCGAGARATAPGYRRVRGSRCGEALGAAGLGIGWTRGEGNEALGGALPGGGRRTRARAGWMETAGTGIQD